MISHLQNVQFEEKALITEKIRTLKQGTKNAYDLSMLLLLSAWLGEKALFDDLYKDMTHAMKEEIFPKWVSVSNKSGVMAWMYGRISAAAEIMGEFVNAKNARINAMQCVAESEKPNAFTAWAKAYVAMALPMGEYQAATAEMIESAAQVTDIYKTAAIAIPLNNDIEKDSDNLKSEKSARKDAIWAWIMVIQAAACHGDIGSYNGAWEQIQEIVQIWNRRVMRGKHQEEALMDLFVEAFSVDNFRAWGLASLLEAAQQMHSNPTYQAKLTNLMMKSLYNKTCEAIKHPEIGIKDNLLARVVLHLVLARNATRVGTQRYTGAQSSHTESWFTMNKLAWIWGYKGKENQSKENHVSMGNTSRT